MRNKQSVNPGRIVDLIELDLTACPKKPAGWDTIIRLSNTCNPDLTPVMYGGKAYPIANFTIDGIVIESGGKIPEISFMTFLADDDGTTPNIARFMNEGGDIRAAKFTRIRVYEKNLDNGSQPSTDPKDRKIQIFYVTRMNELFGHKLDLTLSPALGLDALNDGANRRLSSSQCILKYRTFNGDKFDAGDPDPFDYTPVTEGGCPWGQADQQTNFSYTVTWGKPYLDGNNEPTTEARKDRCSKGLQACLNRFPATLPEHAVPAMINLKSTGT